MHTELLSLMKEEYIALKQFFEPSEQIDKKQRADKKSKPQVVQPEKEKEQEKEQKPETVRLIANTKIRIVKQATEPPVSLAAVEEIKENSQGQTQSSKDLKAWQKEQEQKKLAELTAQGIDPETLLTVDSIKKWILDEKRTFAYAAREYLGMPESKVADFARKHNVKSTISKNRAIIAAKKH
jgi:hypothetical protein